MADDIKKSISSIFSERVSSPFYGTLAISWLIWNWKIIYLTFIIDQSKINSNKIEYIIANYSSLNNLVFLPLISTIILLTLIPFVTNGAYWLDMKFNSWRINAKNQIENKQLLTIEQSIQLRTEIRELEISFEKLLEKKNEEIKILRQELESYTQKKSETISINNTSVEFKKIVDDLEKRNLVLKFETIIEFIDNKKSMDQNDETVKHLLKIGVLEKGGYAAGNKYHYSFSSFGKEFRKYFITNYLLGSKS